MTTKQKMQFEGYNIKFPLCKNCGHPKSYHNYHKFIVKKDSECKLFSCKCLKYE